MSKEEIDVLKEYLTREIPDALQRFRWIKEREGILDADKRRASPTVLQYYPEVKGCYIHQCYMASAVMASIAAESHLRINLYGLPTPEKTPGFKKLISKALSDSHIGKDLADRLDRLRETIRNYIVHPPGMFGHEPLGLRRRGKGPGSYGEADDPYMKTEKEAAEEAIECLLALNRDYPFKIRQHG